MAWTAISDTVNQPWESAEGSDPEKKSIKSMKSIKKKWENKNLGPFKSFVRIGS